MFYVTLIWIILWHHFVVNHAHLFFLNYNHKFEAFGLRSWESSLDEQTSDGT
jgi:hypothetical protein